MFFQEPVQGGDPGSNCVVMHALDDHGCRGEGDR